MYTLSICLCVNLGYLGLGIHANTSTFQANTLYTVHEYIWCVNAAMAKLGANFLGICGILHLFLSYIGGSRVLLLPVMFKTLVWQQLIVGDTLVERGHDVHVLIDAEFSNICLMKGTKVKKIVYTEPPNADTVITVFGEMSDHIYEDPALRTDTYMVPVERIAEVANGVCGRQLRNKTSSNNYHQ